MNWIGRWGKVIRLSHCNLGRNTEEGDSTDPEIFLGSEPFKLYIEYSRRGRMGPLGGLKTSGTDNKAVRNLDCTHEECTYIPTPKTRWRKPRLKISGLYLASMTAPGRGAPLNPKWVAVPSPFCCLALLLSTRVRSAVAEERAHLWKTEQVQTQHSILTEQG